MARQFYSRRHYDRISNGGADTPEQVAERIAHNKRAQEISAQIESEVAQRWPNPTAEDLQTMASWWRTRVDELTHA